MKTPNIYGGGAKTNENGLHFEQTTMLSDAFINAGFTIVGDRSVFRPEDDNPIGLCCEKHSFYSAFLEFRNINYKDYNSKKWLPDDAFVNYLNNTVYIIEKKFQNTSGSVDEKLPGCDFKRWEYQKLCNPIGFKVEYIYILSDWFKQDINKDVLEYITSVECPYYYNNLPLSAIGID